MNPIIREKRQLYILTHKSVRGVYRVPEHPGDSEFGSGLSLPFVLRLVFAPPRRLINALGVCTELVSLSWLRHAIVWAGLISLFGGYYGSGDKIVSTNCGNSVAAFLHAVSIYHCKMQRMFRTFR